MLYEFNNFPASLMSNDQFENLEKRRLCTAFTWLHFFEKCFFLFLNNAQMSCSSLATPIKNPSFTIHWY